MATVTVTYNGQALPTQVRKLAYNRTETEMVFSGIFAADPSNVKALMEALREDDKTLIIGGGAYAETFDLNGGSNTACTQLRTQVEKLNDPNGGRKLSFIQFTVRARLQTKWSSGFRRVDYNWQENEQGIYVLTVQGEVTADGNSTTAKARFEAGIETVENVGKALLGDNDDGDLSNTLFDSPTTFIQIDRHNGDLQFTRSFQENIDPANYYDVSEGDTADREKRDDTIILPSVRVTRSKTLRRGLDQPHLTTYNVTWNARLNKSKSGSSFISQYDGAIRALVIKRIKNIFSENDTLVLESDVIDYGKSEQVASGNWEVTSNDTLVSFSETLRGAIVVADSDKVLDEEDFTEAPYSAGMRLELTQEIRHITRGTPPPTPSAPVIAFNGVTLDTFLKEFFPSEGNEIVGEETGAGDATESMKTGSVVEYTLEWRAVYKAFSKPKVDPFRKTVAGGDRMNIQGKLVNPTG